MGEKPIDLEAVRRADAKLKQLLEDHPELREPDPERQKALEELLEDLEEEENHGGETR
jgi:cytochrome c556